jgi:hypothetical protein
MKVCKHKHCQPSDRTELSNAATKSAVLINTTMLIMLRIVSEYPEGLCDCLSTILLEVTN